MRERIFSRGRLDDAQAVARYHAMRDAGTVAAAKYFSRFDTLTKNVFVAACEAVAELGADFSHDAALLLVSADGADATNRAFFDDYAKNGRTMARGNLFIYTLPTASLAEVAIHFGIRGPLQYLVGSGSSAEDVRAAARALIYDGYEAVFAFLVDTQTIETMYFSR